MKNQGTLATGWAGLVSSFGIRAWMNTLDYRVYFYDALADPRQGCDQPRIYVFWHEYILIPLYLRPHCDLVMLLSRHRDADVLARVAHHMGFGCVRGSSTRGASAALLEMKRLSRSSHLTITPDGPRGPRRKLAQGAVFLASKLGMPIVPLGWGLDRPWRVNSWDRFAVPRPFSRARGIVGPAVPIAPNLGRDELAAACLGIERLLEDLTCEAEDWAQSGASRSGEVHEHPRPRNRSSAWEQLRQSETPALRIADVSRANSARCA